MLQRSLRVAQLSRQVHASGVRAPRTGAHCAALPLLVQRGLFGFLFGKNETNTGAHGQTKAAAIDAELLAILVCPQTHRSLVFSASLNELVNLEDGLAYPINEAGVPVLLKDAARKLDEHELIIMQAELGK